MPHQSRKSGQIPHRVHKTFDRDTLASPLPSLANLPWSDEWTVARISRDKASGALRTSLSNCPLAGVKRQYQWHPMRIDCLAVEKTELLSAMAFEARGSSSLLVPRPDDFSLSIPLPAIAKIARFEWEIPRIGREAEAYQLLNGTGLIPRFLGHIHERGRVIGFVLENLDGRAASATTEDLESCKLALGRLHQRGYLHRDVN